MRKLIVNADDFGWTKGINKGIIQGFRLGIITSTTALVNMPSWEYGADLACKYPRLGIGLHFNLTSGEPITAPKDIPSLVNGEGKFIGSLDALRAADPLDITRELCNQFQRLTRSGIKATHIDSHHNIHSLDNILPIVLAFAARLGLPVRLVAQAKARYRSGGTVTTGELIETFRGRGASGPSLQRLLLNCQSETVELRCHPGLVDAELENLSPYTWQRERELAVVCAFAKEDFPGRHGYTLVSFAALRGQN